MIYRFYLEVYIIDAIYSGDVIVDAVAPYTRLYSILSANGIAAFQAGLGIYIIYLRKRADIVIAVLDLLLCIGGAKYLRNLP